MEYVRNAQPIKERWIRLSVSGAEGSARDRLLVHQDDAAPAPGRGHIFREPRRSGTDHQQIRVPVDFVIARRFRPVRQFAHARAGSQDQAGGDLDLRSGPQGLPRAGIHLHECVRLIRPQGDDTARPAPIRAFGEHTQPCAQQRRRYRLSGKSRELPAIATEGDLIRTHSPLLGWGSPGLYAGPNSFVTVWRSTLNQRRQP